ncbi:MAG: selenide, water dikinase SelD [Lachnospiraceae bacterium]
MGPDALAQVLCHLPKFSDPNLLVGFESSDDASVYRINDETALIQTVDIFPPVVDDPYVYGKIAAANSLSDVYAMGGLPKLAMNIFCFPEDLPTSVLQDILMGGYEKVAEADSIITGGHTLKDPEPKYGLCVSGFAHPRDIIRNDTAKPGDILILTKALGTGILTTAAKGDLLNKQEYAAMVSSMEQLNKLPALQMKGFPVHACTDVTGFGLLGHAMEMAAGSGVSFHLDPYKVPALDGALSYAQMGMVPAASYQNRSYLDDLVSLPQTLPVHMADLLFDPQTSGGLLIALPEKEGLKLAAQLKDLLPATEIIGYADPFKDYNLFVTDTK